MSPSRMVTINFIRQINYVEVLQESTKDLAKETEAR